RQVNLEPLFNTCTKSAASCTRTENFRKVGRSVRVPLIARDPFGQLHPCVPAALVDRILRRRESRIGERAHGHHHAAVVALLGVEYRAAADRAEAEAERRTRIARAHIFGRGAVHFPGRGIPGQCSKNTTGTPLASQAMAHAGAQGLALHLDAQLSATACSDPACHGNLAEVIERKPVVNERMAPDSLSDRRAISHLPAGCAATPPPRPSARPAGAW